jgi:hypothetical protein
VRVVVYSTRSMMTPFPFFHQLPDTTLLPRSKDWQIVALDAHNEQDCIRSAQAMAGARVLVELQSARSEPEHFGYNSLS